MKWVSTNPSLGAGKSSPAMALPPKVEDDPQHSSRQEPPDARGWRLPTETISFLLELRGNNRYDWFDVHRAVSGFFARLTPELLGQRPPDRGRCLALAHAVGGPPEVSMTGRSSTPQPGAGHCLAKASAWSRSAASIR